MKKHRAKAHSARSGGKQVKAKRPTTHGRTVSKRAARPQKMRAAAKPGQAFHSPSQKAADEVPTLEQVTITCANCGRPFKLFKLKGLSLEGTICQRCSLGEMELPESFG
ncbi:hypothetical protein HYU18_03250 [Candidatus Woesearchaeota archaeon]|nr:hypothetical protein [Candidatus Woesearchaeota archaeon]